MAWRRRTEVLVAVVAGVVLGLGVHVAVPALGSDSGVPVEVAGIAVERGTVEATRDAAERSVLRVDALGCGAPRQASATLVRRPDGEQLLLTNAHVVRGAGTVTVTLADSSTIEAPVLGALAGRDAALIELPASGLEGSGPVEPALVGPPANEGDPVALAGFPGGSSAVEQTVVTSIERRAAYGASSDVLLVGAAAIGGISGGALLDGSGRVVGLVAARDPSTGRAVAYPIDEVLDASLSDVPGC